jgi:hypothetical protein
MYGFRLFLRVWRANTLPIFFTYRTENTETIDSMWYWVGGKSNIFSNFGTPSHRCPSGLKNDHCRAAPKNNYTGIAPLARWLLEKCHGFYHSDYLGLERLFPDHEQIM